jgi:DNA polymerase III epsilon subunit family exonuclease
MGPIAHGAALHELEYAVVDVETTGQTARGGDRIIEIAAVVVRNGRPAEMFSTLVNPRRPVSPYITRLTGISNAMLHHAPAFADIVPDLLGVLDTRVFVAHNARFDWSFVSAELERAHGLPLRGEWLCTVRLARRVLSHVPRRNLDAVSAYYEVSNRARHRAHGDAQATAHVFARMLDEVTRQGVHTWADLRRYMRGPARRKRSAMPQPAFDFHIA